MREFILSEAESRASVSNLYHRSNNSGKHMQPSTPVSAFPSGPTPHLPPPQASHLTKEDNHQQVSTSNANHVASLSLAAILSTDEFEPVLISYVIRQLINDPDPGNTFAFRLYNYKRFSFKMNLILRA